MPSVPQRVSGGAGFGLGPARDHRAPFHSPFRALLVPSALARLSLSTSAA